MSEVLAPLFMLLCLGLSAGLAYEPTPFVRLPRLETGVTNFCMSEPCHFGVPERQPLNSQSSDLGLTGRTYVFFLSVIGLAGFRAQSVRQTRLNRAGCPYRAPPQARAVRPSPRPAQRASAKRVTER
jgi:hypothetical protein